MNMYDANQLMSLFLSNETIEIIPLEPNLSELPYYRFITCPYFPYSML